MDRSFVIGFCFLLQGALLLLIVFSIRRKQSECFWNRDETMTVKGLMALIIVLFHSSYDVLVVPELLMAADNYAAVIIVGMFSFLSSYGIERSAALNGNKYLDKLPNRIIRIGLYALVINILEYLLAGVFGTGGTTWICTLILSYVVAIISYGVFKDKAYLFIMVFWLIYSIVMWKYPNYILSWPHQSLLFGFGALYGHYERRIRDCIYSDRKRVVGVVLGIIIVLAFMLKQYYFSGSYPHITDVMQAERCVLTVGLCCLVVVFANFFYISNRILVVLGGISLDLFMLHGICIDILSNLSIKGIWLVIDTVIITILVSMIIRSGLKKYRI